MEATVRDAVNLRHCVYPFTVGRSVLWFGLRENDAYKSSVTLCPEILHCNFYTESRKCSRIGLGNIFEGMCPNFSINFEEILSLTHGNFKVHDKVLESSIFIIHYSIIWPVINPLALELDVYSLSHHLCKLWIFYEPSSLTIGNTRHFVEELTKVVRGSLKKIIKYICWLNI